nr:acetamidase/formamidase family protein [Agrobacterium tumefaciens]
MKSLPKNIQWGVFDPLSRPVLNVVPGEDVVLETLSGSKRNLPLDDDIDVLENHIAVLKTMKPELGPHMMTGPIHIEGAEPGDRLVVEILEIKLAQNWGWNAIEPGFGLMPDLATGYESLTVPLDIKNNRAKLPWGPSAILEPFFGILAVAPDPALGRIGSVEPGPFGGNMDNRYSRAGSRVEFPVFREGALFSAGDGHALQGDGEVCDTALETALNGRFRFSLIKGAAPEVPEIYTPAELVTMAFNPDLNKAADQAARRMVDLVASRTVLSKGEALRHCSMFADLRITQIVNRTKGVHCVLRQNTLEELWIESP